MFVVLGFVVVVVAARVMPGGVACPAGGGLRGAFCFACPLALLCLWPLAASWSFLAEAVVSVLLLVFWPFLAVLVVY